MSLPHDHNPSPQQHHAVMVSSTHTDLLDLRKVLIDAAMGAGLFPQAMEHDSALPAGTVIDSSLGKVTNAAGYVLLIGHRYGQQPASADRNPEQRSITELEFDHAMALGRATLVFMLGDDYPLPPKHVDRVEALVARLEALRAKAKSKDGSGKGPHRVYKVVNSETEFRQAATAGLLGLATHLENQAAAPAVSAAAAPALAPPSTGTAPPATGLTPPAHAAQPPHKADTLLPAPPALCALPPYIGSHEFVGRAAELTLLDDWAMPAEQHPLLLFDAVGGSGKSKLCWFWLAQQAAPQAAQQPAPKADHAQPGAPTRGGPGAEPRSEPSGDAGGNPADHPGTTRWAGRFWYSFYETGASMADCCRQALAYISHQPPSAFHTLAQRELATQLHAKLCEKPWLLVLDGLERVLVAYHRSDAATLSDEALNQPTDQLAERNPCKAARPEDDELLRLLSTARPSKLLVSSRLMPQALLNRAHQPMPGVRREPLRGLRPEDALQLLRQCGVQGNAAAMQRYLQTHCDGHPLVAGALAGLISEPYPAAGNFDTWEPHPAGGGALNFNKLDLTQSRNHILRAALQAVPGPGRDLLATLALLHGGTDREALEALNPHRPAPPDEVPEPDKPENEWDWRYQDSTEKADRRTRYAQQQTERSAYLSALAATLRDLQRRGLLQMGTDSGGPHFDLHPVVRGVVAAELAPDATQRLGQKVVDHFQRQAHNPYEQAQNLHDLAGGFHLVRTLLRMGRFQQALDVWRGDLANAVLANVLGWHELLSLLKPFFPGGWVQPPRGVDAWGASCLMNSVAMALKKSGQSELAIRVHGDNLRLDAKRRDAANLNIGLLNLANTLLVSNHLADALACGSLSFRVADASGDEEQRFIARLNAFTGATRIGDAPQAETLWQQLDGMGRHWSRAAYRPGYAELCRARQFWWQGQSPADPLVQAEQMARGAHARDVLRTALDLRGEWRLAESDAAGALAAWDESASLARTSGCTDNNTETWLALARCLVGPVAAPGLDAERLQAAGVAGQAHYPLARLWLAAGEPAQASAEALAYHRWAWADGEPYVRRFDLDRARRLLTELGEPEPALPPYDATRHQRFDWQDEVEAAIVAIEHEKAERDAKA